MKSQSQLFALFLSTILGLISAGSASADVVAFFDFTNVGPTGTGLVNNDPILDTDSSAQTFWATSNLLDQATGTGALGAGNQTGTNRTTNNGNFLSFSNNREGDAQTPLAAGGNNESTWSEFTITANSNYLIDFTGEALTFRNNAQSNLLGITSADWSVYYSKDNGALTLLDTLAGFELNNQSGAFIGGASNLAFDLSAIGTASSVRFIVDPVSTGGTNGTVNQRRIGMQDLTVNGNIIAIPEPGSLCGLLALGGFALVRRKRLG